MIVIVGRFRSFIASSSVLLLYNREEFQKEGHSSLGVISSEGQFQRKLVNAAW